MEQQRHYEAPRALYLGGGPPVQGNCSTGSNDISICYTGNNAGYDCYDTGISAANLCETGDIAVNDCFGDGLGFVA